MFKKNIANLIKLKTLITLTLIGAATYGFITKLITADVFMPLVTAVIVYYFSKKDEPK